MKRGGGWNRPAPARGGRRVEPYSGTGSKLKQRKNDRSSASAEAAEDNLLVAGGTQVAKRGDPVNRTDEQLGQITSELAKVVGGLMSLTGSNQDAPRQREGTIEQQLEQLKHDLNTVTSELRKNPRAEEEDETRPSQTTETRKSKKTRYVPLPDGPTSSNIRRHLQLSFDSPEIKRSVNPFAVTNELQTLTGQSPSRVFTLNSTSFVVEVGNQEQSTQIETLREVLGVPCRITPYARFNQSRGLVYVNEWTIGDPKMFEADLKNHCNVVKIEEAHFIKPRNPETVPLLLTFDEDTTPYSIYIPGEPADTRVYPFTDKPMICARCQSYGHTAKRCQHEQQRCQRCAGEGHASSDCEAAAARCLHCKEAHPAGHRECAIHQKEQQVLDIQRTRKVTRRQALQLYDGIDTVTNQRTGGHFATHFDCEMSAEDRKKFSPWFLEKCFTNALGKKPVQIRSHNQQRHILHIEIDDETSSKRLSTLTSLNNVQIKVSVNKQIQAKQALVYIREYDLHDFEEYKKGLIQHCGVVDAREATWIKPRNMTTKPILLSFDQDDLPMFITIPGESSNSKVFEYQKRPLMCNKCLEFGHSHKYCRAANAKCRKCGETGHEQSMCQQTRARCHFCAGEHVAGSRLCDYTRMEEEILAIQSRERVSRAQARVLYNQQNPNGMKNYSRAAGSSKHTGKPTDNPRDKVAPPTSTSTQAPAGAPSPRSAQPTEATLDSPAMEVEEQSRKRRLSDPTDGHLTPVVLFHPKTDERVVAFWAAGESDQMVDSSSDEPQQECSKAMKKTKVINSEIKTLKNIYDEFKPSQKTPHDSQQLDEQDRETFEKELRAASRRSSQNEEEVSHRKKSRHSPRRHNTSNAAERNHPKNHNKSSGNNLTDSHFHRERSREPHHNRNRKDHSDHITEDREHEDLRSKTSRSRERAQRGEHSRARSLSTSGRNKDRYKPSTPH